MDLERCIEYVKNKYTITELNKEQLKFIEDCFYLKINGILAYDMGLEYMIIWTLVIAWISENQK